MAPGFFKFWRVFKKIDSRIVNNFCYWNSSCDVRSVHVIDFEINLYCPVYMLCLFYQNIKMMYHHQRSSLTFSVFALLPCLNTQHSVATRILSFCTVALSKHILFSCDTHAPRHFLSALPRRTNTSQGLTCFLLVHVFLLVAPVRVSSESLSSHGLVCDLRLQGGCFKVFNSALLEKYLFLNLDVLCWKTPWPYGAAYYGVP